MRQQVIVDPAGEDGRLHGGRPGLWQGLHPNIQIRPRGTNAAFTVHFSAGILNAITDGLFVNVQADVVHNFFEEPPLLSLNQPSR